MTIANLLETIKTKINPLFFKDEILSEINKTLKDFDIKDAEVIISNDGNRVEIKHPMKELSENTHTSNVSNAVLEINDTNEVSISSISQSYCYRNEVRYGWMQRVGYEVFTQSISKIIDSDGLKLYSSWFSDEAKLEDPEGKRYSSTEELLKDTCPTIENGILKDLPHSMTAPFTNYWKRYEKSNVYRDWGRSPINGEYSNVGITFNGKMEDKDIVKSNYGRTYYQSRKICAPEEDIIKELQILFDESYDKKTNSFDEHNFYYGLEQFQNSVNAKYEI